MSSMGADSTRANDRRACFNWLAGIREVALPHDANILGGINADFDPPASDLEDRNNDVAADRDRLLIFPCEYQHNNSFRP